MRLLCRRGAGRSEVSENQKEAQAPWIAAPFQNSKSLAHFTWAGAGDLAISN